MPFFRMLLPFAAGIWIGWEYQMNWQVAAILLTATLLLFVALQKTKFRKQILLAWVRGALLSLSLFFAGILICWLNNIAHHPQWIGKNTTTPGYIKLVLNEPLTKKTKSFKAEASVVGYYVNEQWIEQKGKVLLYFSEDVKREKLDVGSVIITRKSLQKILNPGNPAGFDYQRYTLYKGITHQLYLKTDDYVIGGAHQKQCLRASLFNTRKYILAILHHYIPEQRERGIAEALLLGYRDELDRELVQTYSNTGVVHIIAISGMHLGLIYGILLLLFRPFKRWRYARYAYPCIIILLLWAFTFMVGATQSVVRAAWMFSFLAAAQTFRRNTNIYNTLAASAFLMLCYNPFVLWDIGFQLSYAAVLGIALVMKPLSNAWIFENKLLQHLWNMTSVTIAAQLLTLPISIYHFHQFPNLFFITNIIAVPMGTIVLIGEIILVVLATFPAIAFWIGKAVSACIFMLNEFVLWVDAFRFAVTEGIYITSIQTALLYVLIGIAYLFMLNRHKKYLINGMLCVLGVFAIQMHTRYVQERQEKIIIYNLQGYTAIDLIQGRKFAFIGDGALLEQPSLERFHLMPSRIAHGVSKEQNLASLKVISGGLQFRQLKMVLYKGGILPNQYGTSIPTDLLVVGKGARASLYDILQSYPCKWVVIDSSNPQWQVKNWKKEALRIKVQVFSTEAQGAFVLSW